MEGIIISIKEDVQELLLLAKSLGYKIKKIFVQKREGTTPCYIGEGKLKEIKEYVCENNISIAFVNDSLRPSQWYNLE
ncbi:GTPase HflX, partial [Thermoplasmatales archaeon ex4484_30]